MQLESNDIIALKSLTTEILPKLITRIKDGETRTEILAQQIRDLQDQLSLLHSAAPKTTVTRKGRKKAETVVPELVDSPPVLPSNSLQTPPDPFETPSRNNIDDLPPLLPSEMVTPVMVEGVPINGTVVNAILYMLGQGLSDMDTISAHLGIPPSVVGYVFSLTGQQRQQILEQFPPQTA